MTARHASGARAVIQRVPHRSAVVAWAGFIAASAIILVVAFG